ncbi:M3 family metallopeptidase [Accumulibacter sp.]|uniref:M3 family metallopeptidase n=1 Tax=Accumulibacter sp. TaxID=2053492 RepID=UPI0025EFDC6F|nr:M3 family metallopeptidase [Accumulibacter sp.]MCM8596727.1 M3 family metallopeptidase [Accumulibacter sp.]MCM8624739.1 M3 family metallopeptidase [Accumulibacter sp.]MDS4050876.1 M3 family metallopeptidase [Accumulibacter sp.]
MTTDTPYDNPLLDFSGLPRFSALAPTHVRPAIAELLSRCRGLVKRLTPDEVPATWADFAGPLGDGLEQLSRAWGTVAHLHAVNDIPDWRDAYNAMLPEVARFYAEVGQNLALFAKYRALAGSDEYHRLSDQQRRVVEHELRDFRLGGAELADEVKPRFQELIEELARLSAKFAENLLDATNAFAERVTDESELTGLPDDARQAARQAAGRDGLDGWKFTLHMPSYLPVMQYADSRRLRAAMYRAYATRASEFGAPEFDNTPLIRRILELRREQARMLGYPHFASLSLVPKMAESVDQVLDFLRDLARRARPFAEKDVAELREFASSELNIDNLEAWDVAYASEKLLQARYAFSENEVKQYFTEDKVLAGLFKLIETLFDVRISEDQASTWHDDVRFFRIDRPGGELVGQFYVDLYARESKRGGAWMDEARGRRRLRERLPASTGPTAQTPVAYLNCNFSPPVAGRDGRSRPATFTHEEVVTLFHETGHGLHHLLTRVDELAVAGIHGVEWDAVELPSQFMENYCWEWSVVEGMSAHVDNRAPLPRQLFDRMLAARNFQSGMQTLRQVEFALFDLLLHSGFDPASERSVLDLLDEVRREVAVIVPPDWHRFPNGFAHIFAGGYAAGYYSYKWAEVLSADCYAAFEEAGSPFDPSTGQRFLSEILSMGGSRPALDSFRAFRGREPQVDALLRHSGMTAAPG